MADETNQSGHLPARWGVRLDPTVNYGHLLSASVFLVTASVAWGVFSQRLDHAETRVTRLERYQEEAVRHAQVEAQAIARLDQKIESLDRVLGRIERYLDAESQRRGNTAPTNPQRGG